MTFFRLIPAIVGGIVGLILIVAGVVIVGGFLLALLFSAFSVFG